MLDEQKVKKYYYMSQNPRVRWVATCARFFTNVVDLSAFYSTSTAAIEKQTEGIREEHQRAADDALKDPKIEQMVEGSPILQKPEIFREISDALARRSIRTAKQTVDSASLVFAHSILDGALTDSCWISYFAKSADWFQLIKDRKVDVHTVLKGKSKLRVQELAEDRIEQLSRESMLTRLDCLHKVCGPRMKGRKLPTAWLKAEKLEAFDQTRHRIIHGRTFARRLPDVLDQIVFAKQAGFSALMLVHSSYNLLRKDALPPMSEFSGLRMCASIKREFPEYWDVLKKYTEMES